MNLKHDTTRNKSMSLTFTRKARSICYPATTSLFQRCLIRSRSAVSLSSTAEPWEERFLEFENGSQIRAITMGEGLKDNIIMLHGSLGRAEDFQHLIPRISSENVRVVSFDLPGFGQSSPKVVDHMSDEGIAKAIWKALDMLGVHNNITLCGHSFGCHTGLEMLEQQEERVKQLILIAPAGVTRQKGLPPMWFNRIVKVMTLNPWTAEFTVTLSQFFYINVFGFPAKSTRESVRNCNEKVGNISFERVKNHLIPKAKDLPVLFFYAADDEQIGEENFEELLSHLNNVEPIRFERGGHNIQKTKAGELVEGLKQFLEKKW